MLYDTVLIADVYQRLKEAQKYHYQVDLTREAEGLSMLVRPFGRRNRRVAIVPENNVEAIEAFRHSGFVIHTMNGNRPTEIVTFMSEEGRSLRANPPERLIVVSNDPAFDLLCSYTASSKTNVSIWSPGPDVPPELSQPDYDNRQLEELLPGTKIKTAAVAIYLDYENLHIGLQHMSITPDPLKIINAVRTETGDLGNIVEINAYADWFELSNKGKGPDIQRTLAELYVKTHYQISKYGKNSADMAMANDIHTRVNRDPGASDMVDTVVLGTRDRDFTAIVETAKARGKKVVVLGLREGFSSDLAQLCEVRFIDKYVIQEEPPLNYKRANEEQYRQIFRIVEYLEEKRWQWVYVNKLFPILKTGNEKSQLKMLIEIGLLTESDQPQKLQLNLEHPDTYLAKWLTNRLSYLLKKKGMEYVDTAYLARGMKIDEQCQHLKIGQTRNEVEKELRKAASVGCIESRVQPHPQNPEKMLTTWWPIGLDLNKIDKFDQSKLTANNASNEANKNREKIDIGAQKVLVERALPISF